MTTLRIGSRGSQLALWQAHWVMDAIHRVRPDVRTELLVIKTTGDKILDVPLAKVGGKGLFVKEIEEAMLGGRIDIAVHSMKDMPAELPQGLCIGAVPKREDPRDALVAEKFRSLADLPKGARVGTSSLRRSAQLLHLRPDLLIEPLRGNLDTRLKKLTTTDLDAIVLAAAGLRRLGLADRITAVLDADSMLPAVGQGALCIESRTDDETISAVLSALDDADTHTAVLAERAFLHRLEGGCQVPIAGHATLHQMDKMDQTDEEDGLTITGLVAELDGSRLIKQTLAGPRDQAAELGLRLADALLAQGAGSILERLEQHGE
jgi:hydroxymethylbilane synthase